MTDFLFWFSPPRDLTLTDRIAEAARAYEHKFKSPGNLCRANPATLGVDVPEAVNGVRVEADELVQVNYFWVGLKEKIDQPDES